MDQSSIDEQFNEQLKMLEELLWIEEQIKNQIKARHSGYSFVLTCYSWSLALCLHKRVVILYLLQRKYEIRLQPNDYLIEKIIQNALMYS